MQREIHQVIYSGNLTHSARQLLEQDGATIEDVGDMLLRIELPDSYDVHQQQEDKTLYSVSASRGPDEREEEEEPMPHLKVMIRTALLAYDVLIYTEFC